MTFKSILLGSTVALMSTASVQAADAIVAAEPEPMEYVRVCDAFGKGFFYIPGTETCLKIGGYVRFDSAFADSPYNGVDGGWNARTRGTLTLDARNDTEYGTVRSFIELRNDATATSTTSFLKSGFVELGGLRAGYTDSRFDTWLNSAGNIINDDVIDFSPSRTNQISYVYGGEKGFAVLIGAEEGAGGFAAGNDIAHPLIGARIAEDWGGLYAIGGYDAISENFAAKLRADLKLNDILSLFVMGGYQSDWDNTDGVGGARLRSVFGSWNGDWAVWAGGSAKISKKASINLQGAYEEDGTYAFALNVDYKIVDGLKIQPELTYTKLDGLRGNDNAFGGTLRLQRSF